DLDNKPKIVVPSHSMHLIWYVPQEEDNVAQSQSRLPPPSPTALTSPAPMKEPIPSPPLQSQSRTAAFIPTKNSKSQITPSPNPSLHPNHRTVAPSGNSASPFSSSPNCIGSPEERDFSTLSHRSMGWSLGRRRGVGGQYRERRRFGGDGSVHIGFDLLRH
ncbi:predicted protein, partial [Arabidopsis lyrata subsp. lyrata]